MRKPNRIRDRRVRFKAARCNRLATRGPVIADNVLDNEIEDVEGSIPDLTTINATLVDFEDRIGVLETP